MPGARVTSGEQVTLRTAEPEDRPFLQRGVANQELRRPLGSPVMTEDDLAAHMDDQNGDWFVVCLDDEDAGPGQPADDEVRRIGSVTVEDADWKRPVLTYWLDPDVHGRGYGKDAVGETVDYVFNRYDTPAVGASAFAFNDGSRGLLESLGFREEGCRRKYMFVDGEHRDMVHYGLLRREWRSGD
jgi:RimJ/RimL family protein N-acetyltransferase